MINYDTAWKDILFLSDEMREMMFSSERRNASFFSSFTLGQARMVHTLYTLKNERNGGAGEITLKTLASKLGISSAAASETVDALVRNGIFQRRKSENDGRAICLDFSEKSNEDIARMEKKISEYWHSLTAVINDEEKQSLENIISKLKKEMKGENRNVNAEK